MKFLAAAEYFYPELGGGEYALRNMMLELENRGHEIRAFHTGKKDPEIQDYTLKIPRIPGGWTRNWIQSFLWKRKLKKIIDQEEPDLIITQLGLAPATQEVCQDKDDTECIILLINYSHLCISQFNHGKIEKHSCFKQAPLKFKWQWPFYRNIKKRYEKAIENAEHVFSNSKFMQNTTKEFLGLETKLLYPPINYSHAEIENYKPEYITMINPSKYKGGEIFAEIAEKMPEEKFLALGEGEKEIQQRLEKQENVKTVKHVEEIKEVYSKTKLLLAPSQWPEPFGMVAPEAMHNKIPALVSKEGGLPEAAGFEELQVKDFREADAWIQKIQSKEWKREKKYREHSNSFKIEEITATFLERI